MIRSRRARALALLAVAAFVVTACSSDKKSETGTGSGASSSSTGGSASSSGSSTYAVDTSDCPSDVNDQITGTIKIGTTMPLSGGAAAAAFAPVAAGLKAYMDDANAKNLVPGVKLELTIEDDQFNPTLTTPAVEKLRDQTGVNLLIGMIGTANGLAVRDALNRDCVPQLLNNSGDPRWGDAANFPWSTGILAPYNTETAIYVEDIKSKFPSGATAAVFNVNSDFGQDYKDTLEKLAADAKINIVDTQTIEGTDSNPPTSQITSIASKKPDVILAVPLGAQCPAFLKEVANAKATTPGWNPRIYITATCASTLLLALAGPAADGIITVVTGIDVADPKNAAVPEVVAYKDVMAKSGFPADGDLATAGAGWSVGEVAVAILKQAAASPDGLTRASIINAARNFSYHPSLTREGITFKSSGLEDPYLNEVQQVVQYSASTKTYTDQGPLVTKFEGKTEKP
jgi:ABC-type branched-subunit amino acid transport system substrate-binding protein